MDSIKSFLAKKLMVAFFLALLLNSLTPAFAYDHTVLLTYYPDKGKGEGRIFKFENPYVFEKFIDALKKDGLHIVSTDKVDNSSNSYSWQLYKISFGWSDPPGCSFSGNFKKNEDGTISFSLDYKSSALYLIRDYLPESIEIKVPGRVSKTNGNRISGGDEGAFFWPADTPEMTLIYEPE